MSMPAGVAISGGPASCTVGSEWVDGIRFFSSTGASSWTFLFPLMDWFFVGTSHAKLDLEDLLDRYDEDPRELKVSPLELLSDTEIDLEAIGGHADRGEERLVEAVECALERKDFASSSGVVLRECKLSDLVRSG